MSTITKTPISSDDFYSTKFSINPKPIFFWDTCALLDIIRLPYRKGTLKTLKSLTEIKKLIDSDSIYSLCSELTIKEWNDHFSQIKNETQSSLDKTSSYHKNSIEIINHIFSGQFISDNSGDKGLVDALEIIADNILQKSDYLSTDKTSNDALRRVANKLPPAAKKPEFKDCVIWETVLDLASLVKGNAQKFVYFTVNTDDYVDKGRGPTVIHGNILSEAITYDIHLVLTVEDAEMKII